MEQREVEKAIQAQREMLEQYGHHDGSKLSEIGWADVINEEGLCRLENVYEREPCD